MHGEDGQAVAEPKQAARFVAAGEPAHGTAADARPFALPGLKHYILLIHRRPGSARPHLARLRHGHPGRVGRKAARGQHSARDGGQLHDAERALPERPERQERADDDLGVWQRVDGGSRAP